MCQWFLSHVQKGQAKKVEVIGAFEGLTKTCRLNARDRMLDSYAHMVIEHHLCVPAVTCARAQNLLVIKTNLFLNVKECSIGAPTLLCILTMQKDGTMITTSSCFPSNRSSYKFKKAFFFILQSNIKGHGNFRLFILLLLPQFR